MTRLADSDLPSGWVVTRLTDAERSAQITALHALAVQRRQTAPSHPAQQHQEPTP